MQVIKGMVQVGGTTFRIVRLSAAHYEVVRVLDDTCVGTFRCAPEFEVEPRTIEAAQLREIARTAIKGAKTSWVGRLPANWGDQLPSAPRT
jgi:hypothetical protein